MCVSFFLIDGLVDIRSALGVYDGNVYESLWKRAQAEPLNKTEVPPGYQVCHDSIPRVIQMAFSNSFFLGIYKTDVGTWPKVC